MGGIPYRSSAGQTTMRRPLDLKVLFPLTNRRVPGSGGENEKPAAHGVLAGTNRFEEPVAVLWKKLVYRFSDRIASRNFGMASQKRKGYSL